jgi:signal transduction histidine kinase
MAQRETVVLPNWRAVFPALQPAPSADSCSYVGVPILATGRIVGVLSMFVGPIGTFAAEDIALLAAIADHVGVAVESARLREQAEQAALVEERQRLARELHDAVTQSLYGLTLLAGAGQDAARAEDLVLVETYLERLAATAQQAIKEMRLMIYELHPPALTQDGLAGALRQRLEAVECRAGVTHELVVETPDLPASLEAALYRIAQEALNNVLKHADATQVTVRIGPDENGDLCLQVTDNGRGFDPKLLSESAGFGLTGIEERAALLGGSSWITSRPGSGTCLTVCLPWCPVRPD